MEVKKGNKRYGKHFELPVILEVVSKAEKGFSRQKLCEEYGMAKCTLEGWLKRHGSEQYQAGKVVRYSVEERRSVVRAILQGRLTVSEAKERYKFRGRGTIQSWIRTFGKELQPITIPVPAVMKDKKSTNKESEEISALKKALAESQLKVAALETMMDIAERELKIDIRKKSGAKQSPK